MTEIHLLFSEAGWNCAFCHSKVLSLKSVADYTRCLLDVLNARTGTMIHKKDNYVIQSQGYNQENNSLMAQDILNLCNKNEESLAS